MAQFNPVSTYIMYHFFVLSPKYKSRAFRSAAALDPLRAPTGSRHKLQVRLMNVQIEGTLICMAEHGEAGEQVRASPHTSF